MGSVREGLAKVRGCIEVTHGENEGCVDPRIEGNRASVSVGDGVGGSVEVLRCIHGHGERLGVADIDGIGDG
jgi:hypothetical protein